MTNINLLPWRAERRKQRQNEFVMLLGLVVVAAAFVVYTVNGIYSSSISEQNERNNYLVSESKILDEQIKEIQELRKTRQQLIERMELIQALQGDRPIIVHLFDELVRAVPEDLYFTNVDVKNNQMIIKGVAKTNTRLSSLMRNIGSSQWLEEPSLVKMQGKGEEPKIFEITTIKRSKPKSAGEGEDNGQ